MNFFEKVVSREGVEIYSAPHSREKALYKLSLLLKKQVSDEEATCRQVYDGAIEREHIGSTAVGHGVAYSHYNCESLKRLYAVVGIFPDGIVAWESPDDKPIHILFLIASPDKESCRYFAFITHISRMLRSNRLITEMKNSNNPDHIYDFLLQWERKHGTQLYVCQK